MKELRVLLTVYFLMIILIIACTKVGVVYTPEAPIDLGKMSTNTSIKSFVQTGNTITAEFVTTPGAKYSLQIVPFDAEKPVKVEGFTATDSITKKVYNLDTLAKKNYDLHLLDVIGNDIKHPITIK